MRLVAIHSIQHSGTEYPPGAVFEIADRKAAERLIKLGSADETGKPVTGGAPIEDLTPTMPTPPVPGSAPAPTQGQGSGNGKR